MSQKSEHADETEIDASLDDLPDDETIDETVVNLEANGFEVVVADTAEAALETIQSHISDDVSVMNGHSTTPNGRPLAASPRLPITFSVESTRSHRLAKWSRLTVPEAGSVPIHSLLATSLSLAG